MTFEFRIAVIQNLAYEQHFQHFRYFWNRK